MAFNGIEQLKDLRRKLQEAAAAGPSGLKHKMLSAAGQAFLTQIQMGFRTSTDPYGQKWAPLQVRQGMPLRDTGRLANSFSARATENGVEVGTNVDDKIVVTHQEGRVIRPVNAKMLRFKVPGAIGKRGRRGPSSWAFAKRVEVPARKMVPDNGDLPDKWRDAADKAAGLVLTKWQRQLVKK